MIYTEEDASPCMPSLPGTQIAPNTQRASCGGRIVDPHQLPRLRALSTAAVGSLQSKRIRKVRKASVAHHRQTTREDRVVSSCPVHQAGPNGAEHTQSQRTVNLGGCGAPACLCEGSKQEISVFRGMLTSLLIPSF